MLYIIIIRERLKLATVATFNRQKVATFNLQKVATVATFKHTKRRNPHGSSSNNEYMQLGVSDSASWSPAVGGGEGEGRGEERRSIKFSELDFNIPTSYGHSYNK